MELKELWKKVKKYPNVIAYSGKLQPRIRKGKVRKELCFRVYVTKKLPEVQLRPQHIIPKTLKVGGKEIPTDVVEIGEIKALSIDKTKKHRPAPAGVSIGHYKITAGTLGWYAEDEDGEIVIVSNNHVLANENKAKKGDPILQPGPYDGGTLSDQIAELKRFVPLKFGEYNCKYRNFLLKIKKVFLGEAENKVDIACASPLNPNDIKTEIVGIGKVRGKRTPKVGDKVQKSGRTTCHTLGGEVIDDAWNGYVWYSRGKCFFVDQILISKKGFSAGGDSGSLILDMDNNAVAWLFAGSETTTVANKIEHVERELNVEILTFQD